MGALGRAVVEVVAVAVAAVIGKDSSSSNISNRVEYQEGIEGKGEGKDEGKVGWAHAGFQKGWQVSKALSCHGSQSLNRLPVPE